jgi:hypothetical protein
MVHARRSMPNEKSRMEWRSSLRATLGATWALGRTHARCARRARRLASGPRGDPRRSAMSGARQADGGEPADRFCACSGVATGDNILPPGLVLFVHVDALVTILLRYLAPPFPCEAIRSIGARIEGQSKGNRGKFPGTQLRDGFSRLQQIESFESLSFPPQRRSTALSSTCPGICPGYE